MSEQSIGDYKVIRDLGGGGMARVFLGVHKDVPNLRVVLKILRDPRMADRFSQEADKLALLDRDRHVCQLKHFFKHGDETVIAMEHIEGPTLEQRVAEAGTLPVREAVDIIAIVLDVLAKAHARNIWHRDIKPSNIMLEHGLTKAVKVIDFGIAKADSDPALTAAGSCCGTPLYMAPEQFVPTESTNYSLVDVYAVGVTLYNLLTGELPFKGDNEFAIRDAKLNETPIPPRKHNSAIPAEIEAVILKAIARDPESRYQSAPEMKQALLDAAGVSDVSQTLSTGKTTGETPEPVTSGTRTPAIDKTTDTKRRPFTAKTLVAGAVVIVVAAIVIWLATRSEETAGPPVAPSTLAPGNGSEIEDLSRAGFAWGTATGTDVRYFLQYDNNPEFISPVGVSNLADTTHPMDTTLPPGSYFWRVRAISRGIIGPYSEVASFVVAGPTAPELTTGRLLVTSNMAADISVNDDLVRRAATQLDTVLPTGRHRIAAVNRNTAERQRNQTVTIGEGESTNVDFRFTPRTDSTTLRVTSEPAFAEIYIDGRLREGVQTPHQFELPVGSHVIKVVKDGEATEQRIDLRSPSTYKFFIEGDSVVRRE
jgi:serine/threonine-protein kinase